jgi:hypothetical protein
VLELNIIFNVIYSISCQSCLKREKKGEVKDEDQAIAGQSDC